MVRREMNEYFRNKMKWIDSICVHLCYEEYR